MYIGIVMLLLSLITTIAAAAVAIIWFLFGRKENRGTDTGNSNSASKSAFDPSSTDDSSNEPYAYTEKVFDENVQGSYKLEKFESSNKQMTNLSDGSESDLGTNATEIEISGSDFNSTGTSQDSGEGSRVEDQVKIQNFGGNNLRSKTIIEEEKMSSVTVNGHLMLDRLVKKAEKLAGPIQPGEYWYDFRAGFWGVMGGPCLGIIPPFIEEFKYKMRQDCAGGNTRILVNGRELTEKDLHLLGSRGFPTEENKSYILEISGRILDVDSNEELDSLGKLAPTIEKKKRGFSMKIPRSAS